MYRQIYYMKQFLTCSANSLDGWQKKKIYKKICLNDTKLAMEVNKEKQQQINKKLKCI